MDKRESPVGVEDLAAEHGARGIEDPGRVVEEDE